MISFLFFILSSLCFARDGANFQPSFLVGGILSNPQQYNLLTQQNSITPTYTVVMTGISAPYHFGNFLAGLDYRALIINQTGVSNNPNNQSEIIAGRLALLLGARYYKQNSFYGFIGTYSFFQHAIMKIKNSAQITTLDSPVFNPSYSAALDIGWKLPTSWEIWFSTELGYIEYLIKQTTLSSGGQGPHVNLSGPYMLIKIGYGI